MEIERISSFEFLNGKCINALASWYQAKFGAVSDLEPCYIVFGSVSSEDCDVMVRVPFDQLARVTNNMLVLNKELDALLGGVIGTDKVINSCFGDWRDGVMVDCQKGSLEETNNALRTTFANHPSLQMLSVCPIERFLPRDLRSKQLKVFYALRMIMSTLSHANYKLDWAGNMRRVLTRLMSVDEFATLSESEAQTFKNLCIIYDIQTQFYNRCVPSLSAFDASVILKGRADLLRVKNKLKHLLKVKPLNPETFPDAFLNIYLDSKKIVDEMMIIIEGNREKFDATLMDELHHFLSGCELTLKKITRFALKIRLICFQTEYLDCMDLSNIEMFHDERDKLKKVAFQIGQTLSLIRGVELFEKESIAAAYPGLNPFLFRMDISLQDWEYINELLHELTKLIYDENLVERNLKELDLKDLVKNQTKK